MNLFSYLSLLFFLLSWGCGNILVAQNLRFERGQILDSLPVMESKETYALYIPTSYTEENPSSIIFIFDPVGRGRTGIHPFLKASETYGHILVCSNDSRNGPYERNIAVVNRLFATIFQTFTIDEQRVYLSGFSGGARLATTIAVMTGKIAGVVSCGSGFSPNALQIPTMTRKFSYVGIVGDRDMNFQELFRVGALFSKFGINNEILTFEGEHRWPSSEIVLRAFDWLELQDVLSNKFRMKDTVMLAALHRNYQAGLQFERKGAPLAAVNEYDRVLRMFRPYFNLDTVRLTIKRLRKEKAFKIAVSKNEKIKKEEEKIRERFEMRFFSELNNNATMTDTIWWVEEFQKIKKIYIKSPDPAFQKMGERIINAMNAVTYETGEEALRNLAVSKALYCHHLRVLLLPEQSYPYFQLARDYALQNNLDKTLKYLALAVAKGFTAKERVLSTAEFKKYHQDPKFQKLLERL
ncbi:hypothetical protein [Altibacter sp.]|uniref:TPR end-of-group domain-containing protein n=1 Tax=Altibacter sp. TaxID=2024823 RepID=UPI000C9738ED|nr:hypothetical protein [Altibacter sp.]MAP54176.1 hypothetical protein [Altibacter sp.]